MQTETKSALIKIIPQSVLVGLLAVIVIVYFDQIEDMLDQITHVEALGLFSIEIDQALVPDKFKASLVGFQLSESLSKRLGEQRNRLQSARILITKDKPNSARWLADVFRQLGAQVDLALCSEETRKLLSRYEYDIVISDISWDQCTTGYTNAIDFFNSEVNRLSGKRTIFFITNIQSPREVPDYALDITTDLTELIHLTLDILERGSDA